MHVTAFCSNRTMYCLIVSSSFCDIYCSEFVSFKRCILQKDSNIGLMHPSPLCYHLLLLPPVEYRTRLAHPSKHSLTIIIFFFPTSVTTFPWTYNSNALIHLFHWGSMSLVSVMSNDCICCRSCGEIAAILIYSEFYPVYVPDFNH